MHKVRQIYYHAAVWLRHRFSLSEIKVLVRSLLLSESWGSLQKLLLLVDLSYSVLRGCLLPSTIWPSLYYVSLFLYGFKESTSPPLHFSDPSLSYL